MKKLNYYNDNTKDILKKYSFNEIFKYYKDLIYWVEHTDDEAPIQERFKSNIKHVKEAYPECVL